MIRPFLISLFLVVSLNLVAQNQTNTFCNKKIVGYITNWSPNFNIDYSNLTHAFFAFLNANPNGNLIEYTLEEEMALTTYLKQTKKYSCKRFISLGGGGTNAFPLIAADTEARKNFITNVIAFCKLHKFDGIDIDWEAMDDDEEKKNYTLLLGAFREAVDANGLELVATIGFGNYWCQWIEDEALQKAHWIQLMIYDQTGTWSESPFGNHASFEHFLQAEAYWTNRGFTRDKIVMGLPFYGYKFTSKNGGTGVSKKYSEIIAAYPSLTPEDDQTPGNDWCFFNGPVMIEKKCTYALENGFAGVMVWEMSQDEQGSKSLHQAIVKAFKSYCQK